jgi:hypothetical protein
MDIEQRAIGVEHAGLDPLEPCHEAASPASPLALCYCPHTETQHAG